MKSPNDFEDTDGRVQLWMRGQKNGGKKKLKFPRGKKTQRKRRAPLWEKVAPTKNGEKK